jgi:stage II sporulation protein AA (anti-sigma F factor antagonist)
LYDELDECSAQDAREIIDKLINENFGISTVVFDLSGLTFMDSTGIGLLIGRYKRLKQMNVKTYISGAAVAIEKVIVLSGLYSIMPKC